MKKSNRYMSGTLIAAAGVLVAWVGLSRLYGVLGEPYAPERTSAAELAALSDFSRVELRGDFRVELVRRDGHGVEYFPPGPRQGELRARREGDALLVEGFGNRGGESGEGGLVRIAMPRLDAADISFVPSASVEGFSGMNLALRLLQVESITVRGNDFDSLQALARGSGTLRLEDNRFGAEAFDVNGAYRVEVAD